MRSKESAAFADRRRQGFGASRSYGAPGKVRTSEVGDQRSEPQKSEERGQRTEYLITKVGKMGKGKGSKE